MAITKKAVDNDKEKEKILELLTIIDIEANDISLYVLAFIHRSIVNERKDFAPTHNERLEFLGDAVLELVITDNLYSSFSEKTEGELTDLRSAIVRGKNLSKIAKDLNFQSYLYLGKGEEKTGGRDNDYILANTIEAFLGALYKDKGYAEAKKFVDKYIYSTIDEILEKESTKDYKTLLQEYTQAVFDITPHYDVISDQGPDHNKTFEVGVYMGEKMIGVGIGTSKKKSQENAARDGFYKLKNEEN